MRAGEWRHGDGGAGISGAGLGTFGPPGPPPWKGHVASCAVMVPVRRQSASAGLRQQPEPEPEPEPELEPELESELETEPAKADLSAGSRAAASWESLQELQKRRRPAAH